MWQKIFNEKFKIFRTWFWGGALSSGVLLYGTPTTFHSVGHLALEFTLKFIATFALALASGVGAVLAAPMVRLIKRWFKNKFGKKKKLGNFGETFSDNHKKSA